ncbi:MAG: SMI1/KNR4 family protein [Luteolibacter sp.]
MNEWISELIAKDPVCPKPAAMEVIERVEQALDCQIPYGYKEFLLASDGISIEGAGRDCLRLLGCEAMLKDNAGYQVAEYVPDYLMIGNDGGDCFYFMKRNSPQDPEVFMLLAGAFFEDEIESMGPFGETFIRRFCGGEEAK